jgi:SAM-dependent MidA family methyltransferase
MMDLRALIVEEIGRRGPIPFSRYMELCLYHPELGYYSRRKEQFGKAGDFYTASDVHAVFGRLLARQFDEMWRALGAPPRIDILELGPGRGLFASDVLEWSKKKFPDFLAALHYTLIERSPNLRLRLQERLAPVPAQFSSPAPTASRAQTWAEKINIVGSLDELGPAAENVIVFANEFFDALPVEVIDYQGELRVAAEGNTLVETFAEPNPEVLEFIDHYGIHPAEGERTEAALVGMNFMKRIAERVRRGFVVLIDYGYTREELLAGRSASTVRAFRQHAISNTPYEAPGEQDITANVNFTALREAGLAAGLEAGHLLTQAQFLMGIGEPNEFADAFDEARLPQEQAKVTLQLKHLITPAGMGEVFQVLLMHRGVDKDRTFRLAGMKYGRK